MAGVCLLAVSMEQAHGQSIVTDGDIVGDGISLKALKESHCEHLKTEHSGTQLPDICISTWFVFVTSASSDSGGNLVQWANNLTGYSGSNGLEAGDAICQHHADNAPTPLPGTYKAWLSTDTVDAKDRIGDHQWVLPDGTTVVADSLADLLDCNNPECLQNTINQTETAAAITENTFTGTRATGQPIQGENCQGWTFNAGNNYTIWGRTTAKHGDWTSDIASIQYCMFNAHLYCFSN